jgi:Na+/alanine symporter
MVECSACYFLGFDPRDIGGGIDAAIVFGVKRGLFSNEALDIDKNA